LMHCLMLCTSLGLTMNFQNSLELIEGVMDVYLDIIVRWRKARE